ncbi:TonB-dependent receptor [Stakelama saccharophila]|uniref:TonB-dependent receptor n=1 Tax=Stakelama saccharophila TaxID=3075605 RepID=A0ABZ0B4W9_9SPHN|nr:TonB-dependent receptor [Stakelama sp. W311]WNO52424.1 TonB-dependent receptor [Stakelama sp. W311]
MTNTALAQDVSSSSDAASAGQAGGQELQSGKPFPPTVNRQTANDADSSEEANEIVVTGIRRSLERAADIKKNASQVVDAIVAEDIGKFPDPTTSAALQRVPGVQVSVDSNNELGNVLVRGLPDILTTVSGREVFTTTGRSFNLHFIPAQALAAVKVYKSQSPDLIEGGLAGQIDLNLNRPFNFEKPTLNVTVRNRYATEADKSSPTIAGLVTDSWDTGAGKIGILVNGSYQRDDHYRAQTQLLDRRSSAAAPLGEPGYLIPNILRNFANTGTIERRELNGSIQWQVTPALQAYVDGLYVDSKETASNSGANIQAFTTGTTLGDVTASDNCFDARVNENGYNARMVTDPQTGESVLQPYTVQNVCEVDSATLESPVVNSTSQAHHYDTDDKLIAGGLKYDQGGLSADIDVSYQKSHNSTTDITADIGKRLPSLTFRPDVDNVAAYTVPGNGLLENDGFSLRNSFQQRFSVSDGSLFAVKGDVAKEFGGILKSVKIGGRYAKRKADQRAAQVISPFPGGNVGTASEADAVMVGDSGLPNDFLSMGDPAPGLNDGASYLIPNPDFLLSERGQDALRAYVGQPMGRPDYQPSRRFSIDEETIAGYVRANYDIPITGRIHLGGLVGGRLVRTKRDLLFFHNVTTGEGGDAQTTVEPIRADTTDTDFLPNVTAKLDFGNGLQARMIYSKSLRRPEFTALNPALNLTISANPFIQNSGGAGNPDLKPQKSNSYDATLGYYFNNGYIAVAGYYRDISNRVISGSQLETIDGVDYNITRPRNIGKADLKGVEVNGQYFFDFLPGALAGLGLQGSFTYLDSKVKGDDPLAGYPLLGVSKYNYTAGLLYDHSGVSGRLVYTYRSKYDATDQSGSNALRPIDSQALFGVVRPAGRLDFSIGYDIDDQLRIDVGGTNILKNETKTYYGSSAYNFNDYLDETTYSIGLRIRI